MSKKTFKGGFDTLLGEKPQDEVKTAPGRPTKAGRPKTQFKEITKTSQEGTREGETRATFILGEDLLDKVKAVAYWDRMLIKEVVTDALQQYLERYEEENGAIQPQPKR